MRSSIYDVFKVVFEAYLLRDGKSFLDSELTNLVEHMLKTATVVLDGDVVCLTTNNALIQLDDSELRVERELPRLFMLRETRMFATAGAELVTDKQFTLQSSRCINDVEEFILNYNSDIVVLDNCKAVDYSVFDSLYELDEDELEGETRYTVWGREAYTLDAVGGLDEVLHEGFTSKRYLVERIKELSEQGFEDFRAFSIIDNNELYFKLFSLSFDSLSEQTRGSLGLVFTDAEGDRLFDRYDSGDSFLPF